jgi:transposase InsO family protein
MVDDFTRASFGLVVDSSLTGLRVVRELDHLVEPRGYPCTLVSDNGAELTSNAILAWRRAGPTDAEWLGVELQRLPAGRVPQQAPVHQPQGGAPDH